jgi:DNA-binding NarL/FixJ family response regulator
MQASFPKIGILQSAFWLKCDYFLLCAGSTAKIMTSIAIVEDNPVMRKTFRRWVDAGPDFRCVFACATAEEAVAEIPRLKPDVVLMDIHLPGESGIACTARLKDELPGVQVIMLTVYRNQELIFQALQAGACGYLLKRSSPEELLKAIAEVRSGGAPMTSEIARMVVEAFQKSRRTSRRPTG